VVLSVTDSGCGIQDADLQRIFQRFARAEPNRSRRSGGLGLGLAIVQAIARAHGATLTPRAQAEGGLDVEVTFPGKPASAQGHLPAS
jgi:signal transduction histidine kinase